MAQSFVSSSIQSVGNPGFCIFQFIDPTTSPYVVTSSVSFSNAKAVIYQPMFAPIQRVNLSESGQTFIFQLSTNEELTFDVQFQELPYDDSPVEQSQGFATLRDFVRFNLNYSQFGVIVTAPDGFIETCRYIKGLESFQEAKGQSQKRQRWAGTMTFRRLFTT